jgi:DNA modification methylase
MPANSVDAIITDPPYLEDDYSSILDEFMRVAKRVVVTPGKIKSFDWIQRQKPVWEYIWKTNSLTLGGSASFHIGFEPILAYHYPLKPLGNDVLDYPISKQKGVGNHPHPKPLGLIKKLVTHWAKAGDLVLDPFMGSGTTGVACLHTDRRFIGIEIKPEYLEIARRRIEVEQLQMRMPI